MLTLYLTLLRELLHILIALPHRAVQHPKWLFNHYP